MTTLDLDDSEVMALLLLLKLGMDAYTGNSVGEAMEALINVPNRTLDRLIAKVSLAGSQAAKAAHVGEA